MLAPPSEKPENASGIPKKTKYRVPAAEILPSDRFSFQVHLDVMKRFVTLSHNGNQPLDASRVEGERVPTQGASLNVRFLKSVGLLNTTDRGQYLPTQDGIRFVTARTVSDDRARPILATLIERTWIASTARSVLISTSSTKDEILLGELAMAAQTDKTKKESALQVLVDYLLFSGIVRRTADGLTLVSSPDGSGDAEKSSAESDVALKGSLPEPLTEQAVKGWHVIQTEDFMLRIRSSAEAVDDLTEHLQTLRRKIERLHGREFDLSPASTAGGS